MIRTEAVLLEKDCCPGEGSRNQGLFSLLELSVAHPEALLSGSRDREQGLRGAPKQHSPEHTRELTLGSP